MQRIFTVAKANLAHFKTQVNPIASLEANEVLLKIDHFAFTANNMTYANAGGPPLNYWNFYQGLS